MFFYSVILLLISGVGLSFVESIPWSLTRLRYLAVTVHVVASLATIGAIIIHVYMGVFMEPESLRAMIHGRVSRAWARAYHRLWSRGRSRGIVHIEIERKPCYREFHSPEPLLLPAPAWRVSQVAFYLAVRISGSLLRNALTQLSVTITMRFKPTANDDPLTTA